MFLSTVNPHLSFRSFSPLFPHNTIFDTVFTTCSRSNFLSSSSFKYKHLTLNAISRSDSEPDPNPSPSSKPETKNRKQKTKVQQNEDENLDRIFPTTIPKKPRRGRKSEAAAVEDFVRDSLEQTFASIRQQNSEILKDKESIMKDKVDDEISSEKTGSDDEDDDENDNDEGGGKKGKKMVVEEENSDWPLDAEVGWGIRASDYFEQHPIKNVVGEDGVEIDWEGETDDNFVKEINCLEWETFAFHPSPLIVLVFERYNR